MSSYDLLVIFLADYLVYLMFLGVVLMWVVKFRFSPIRTLFSAVIAFAISYLLKFFFYFPRPFILTGHQPIVGLIMDSSFPSSHTAVAFALSLSLLFAKKKISLLFLILSLLVALGRILSGVHTLADVFGGIAVAALSVAISHRHFSY
jgi:undecaprenyl-diphosphatase